MTSSGELVHKCKLLSHRLGRNILGSAVQSREASVQSVQRIFPPALSALLGTIESRARAPDAEAGLEVIITPVTGNENGEGIDKLFRGLTFINSYQRALIHEWRGMSRNG
ncbi:hypothetical protein LshimejAT787_0804810 [Lyophyllum shimeji]|uniref:Uncharacterized protein n=1 Tax=Lyophyllum shimeji TaxID=47721 RepID=A0A9P3PRE0_LYOSH|nr:hypothetical protein LshimejAT787_0804810 [Lyophyllum shimeji]